MKKYSKSLCIGMVSLLVLSTQITITGCGPSTPSNTIVDNKNIPAGSGVIKGVVTAEGISTKGFTTKGFSIKGTPDVSLATVKVSSAVDTKEVKCEKDGSFAVPVKAGDYTVEATVPDGNGGTLKFVSPDKVNVPIANDPPIVDIKSLVTRKTGSIQGVISIDGTEILEGMDVFIPGTSSVGKTNDKGRFAITGVAAGKWKIVIQKPGFDRGIIENIVVNAGEATLVNQKITLKKGNAGAGLKGIVQDSSGNAVPGATVTAYPLDRKTLGEGGLDNFIGITNEKGEYEILNLPLGKYQVQLYRSFYNLPARQEIEITAATKDMGILKLVSTVVYFGKISGKVVDEKGKPLDGVIVQTKPQVTDQQITDMDGNFTLDRVMPGEYNLNLATGGYLRVTVPIRVENMQNYELKLPNPFKLTTGISDEILVINPDGTPIKPVPNPPVPSTSNSDFGDAPNTYGTLLSSNCARHLIDSNFASLKMGTNAGDTEADGLPNSTASGDDTNGIDDEDGVISFPALSASSNLSVKSFNTKSLNIKATVTDPLLNLTLAVVNKGQNGTDISSDPKVLPNDILEYTITLNNVGNSNALKTQITNMIPMFTTYVPGSLVLNGVPKTDTVGDDTAFFNSSSNLVQFNVGPDATATLGGTLPVANSRTLSFKVKINDRIPAATVIGNQASATYEYSNTSFTSTSNLVANTIGEVPNLTVTPDGTASSPGQSQNAEPNSIVYFSYRLTNTGNNTDIFKVTTTIGPESDFNPVPGSVKVYLDLNGNGVVDVGDTLVGSDTNKDNVITAGAEQVASTRPIAKDEIANLIVWYEIPQNARSGQKINFGLDVSSVGNPTKIDVGNFNRTTIGNPSNTITIPKNYSVNVNVTNNTGSSANLRGWIDFNGNGTFESNESASVTVATGTTGVKTLTWNNLSGLIAGQTYARIRLTTDALSATDFNGVKSNGEVEDYSLTISP